MKSSGDKSNSVTLKYQVRNKCIFIRNCWTEMLARSLGHAILKYWSIFDPNVKYNFIQHCFCDLGSHFEARPRVSFTNIFSRLRLEKI
jgi:hypothetical protein